MKAFRLSRSLILAIALAVSLGANVTLFVGGVVYSVVDEFVEQAFGLATDAAMQRRALAALKTGSAKQAKALAASRAVAARQRGELSTSRAAAATQRREIGKLKAISAKQRREIAALKALSTKQGRALNAAKTVSIRQGRELAALSTAKGKLPTQLGKIRHSTVSVAKRSRKRLVNSLARSIVTATGKVMPFAGAAIVVGLTAWEIKDFCSTIRDLDEIRRAVGESKAEAESEPADCSRPDLAAKRAVAEMTSYSREAWEENKKYVPDLPDWEDIPDSWRDDWRRTVPDILRGTLRGTWDRLKRLFP